MTMAVGPRGCEGPKAVPRGPGPFLLHTPLFSCQVDIQVMFNTLQKGSWGDLIELHANVSW